MADKIKIKVKVKITKDDINAGIVEMPDGYKIEKYKTKKEFEAEALEEADRLEANLGKIPNEKDLVDYAKQDHPYYQTLEEIEQLRKKN